VSAGPEAVGVLLIGCAIAAVCLLRPEWILPTFIGLTWMAVPASLYGGLPSPVELGGVVLLGFAAWRAARVRDVAAPVLIVSALLALAAVGTTLASPEDSGIPVDWLGDLSFLLIAALAVRAANVDRVVVVLCAVGAFLALGGVYSILVGPSALFPLHDEVTGPEAARAAGPFGEANFFALSLASLGPLCVYLVIGSGPRRALGGFALCCLAGGVLATGSRGGALALVVGLVAAWLLLTKRRGRALGVAALAAAALLPVFSAQIESSEERTVSGRATENRIAVAMFADHPVTGVGVDVYPTLYRDYARKIGNDPRHLRAPHSLPLQVAAEQGLFGIVAWLAAATVLVGYAITRRVWHSALGRATILAVGTYCVGSLFLQGSQIRLLFILVGLVFALGAGQRHPVSASAVRLTRARFS
jgi:putative inorganic carbon (hco3(-)) transporter